MMKKRCSLVFSIIVISLFLCHGSFAQIPVSPDLQSTPYREWSGGTLDEIKACSQSQEQAIYDTLPPYQQLLYDETKAKLEGVDRLSLLESITVYAAKSGVTFDQIGDYYKALPALYLEDVNDIANSRNISNIPDKLRLVLAKIPPGYFDTPADRDRLEAYITSIESGAADLKGLIGTSTEAGTAPAKGSYNISILPIYVEQIYVAPTCKYKVHDFSTDVIQAWVIISYYSKPFERPPLERTPTP